MVTLGLKLKSLKTCEKRLYNLIRVLLWKKPLEKMLTFAKLQEFEKWQNWLFAGIGCSFCERVGLGVKLKLRKYMG